MIPLGIVLQVWSVSSLNIMRNGRWLYIPICLLGVKVGQVPDGYMVLDVVDSVLLALAAYAVIRAAEKIYARINPEILPTETLIT